METDQVILDSEYPESADVITQKLNIDSYFKPVQQKRRKIVPEIKLIINEEVDKLLDMGMIREVMYPEWLANVVVVQKKNGKWRVYVDYTDLNKACPKDTFPLPHIDAMVDATAGHEMQKFMDASRKFLGYMVTKRSIEASPEQIKAILELQSPRSVKDIQKLTGRVAALNRFISRSSKRCKTFYSLLRKNKQFHWTPEHEAAFQDLKFYLSSPPLLVKPEKGEPLSVYLSVTNIAVSAVLVKEQEGRMAKWSVQLSTYDITFEPGTAIKSRALVDFVADFSPNLESDLAKEVNHLENETSDQEWTLFTDGASNVRGIGLGLVLKSPQGDITAEAVSCEFKATNNEAEYEALTAGLKADALASLGSNFTPAIFDKILIVHLLELAISKPEQVNPVSIDNNSWTKPYYEWFL
ncbi:uncharacterized protein LOC141607827 [Silene latifolia]|uniref:uncharacterized protein LOC141607827 n=1 Tax=Silene latifolia TaxID=37657 RepID=UPI003D7790E9